jgi:hypothetical protein
MTISIFWRLILSHIGILLLSGATCLYSIIQLGSLSGTARSALDTNHRLIDYQEALTDAFLSQIRYGGKYLITHAETRYRQSRQFKKDFMDYLSTLKKLEESQTTGVSLARIERLHEQYHELFDRETAYIRANQSYAQTRYQQERDKVVESTLSELEALKLQLRAKLLERLESIDRGARTARRIATVTTLVVLLLGGILSLRVSKAIGAPASKPLVSRPFLTLPRVQSLRTIGFRLLEWTNKLWNLTRLQADRVTGLAFAVGEAWSRRIANLRNASARKGTEL